MSLFRALFELFVIYLVFKLIIDLVIPVFQTTRNMKQKIGEMQQKMNEQMKQQQSQAYRAKEKDPVPGPKKDDYIEFEEVK